MRLHLSESIKTIYLFAHKENCGFCPPALVKSAGNRDLSIVLRQTSKIVHLSFKQYRAVRRWCPKLYFLYLAKKPQLNVCILNVVLHHLP